MPKQDELLSHDYDGIREYDNSLPLWWLYLFLGTVVFALGYIVYYHFGTGQSQEQLLVAELQAADEAAAKKLVADVGAEKDKLLALTKNSAALEQGRQVFATKCVACHLAQGQGLVGPNLTDDYWIHGGKITDIKNTVVNGVLDKGMLAWKTMLSGDEINAVVAYVWTLHGSNPPNPKAPQGNLEPRQEG